ncbi:MAG: thiamine pyrophosphate-binding protein [Bacteroidota bacterium]
MAGKCGKYKVLEQFIADDCKYMFGNPGTVEQGFLDALGEYPQLKYILTLQESVAVLIADGYARATQKPALVQLHSSPGIGNAVGALYQAMRGHSPLVVVGGDAGIRYANMDAQMAADLVGMMKPVTKYATMVTDSSSLLRTVRRAVKIAGTPPMGPVYVCLPMDILEEINHEDVLPTTIPSTRVVPDIPIIRRAAEFLLEAVAPMIFVGDGIAYSGAQEELTKLAELLGAEVYAVDAGDLNMDFTHPLYQGATGHMFGSSSLPITQKGDVNLLVGTYMLPEVFPELGNIFAEKAKVIHFDLNAYEIAKNHPVDIAAVCDPKLTLKALHDAIEAGMNRQQQETAAKRREDISKKKSQRINTEKEADRTRRSTDSLAMFRFAELLSAKIPTDTLIFDEALTNSPALTRYIPPRKPGRYFVTRGGSLGVGIPGAMGLKLAHPEKTVIGFTGDGGSMYTIQALWTGVRHSIGAKYIVCNNSSYRLLQLNIDAYWKERNVIPHQFPLSFDLSHPPLRFDLIGQAMGVNAVRVEKYDEIEPAIDRMLSDDNPFLIDLVVSD